MISNLDFTTLMADFFFGGVIKSSKSKKTIILFKFHLKKFFSYKNQQKMTENMQNISDPEQMPIKMISQSGKRTIFLFQNAQRRILDTSFEKIENTGEIQRKTVDINKYIQKKLDLLNKVRENPKTYTFNAVSRCQLDKRVKSNSPKNNGEFYQLHYEAIEKKAPFLAKIRKSTEAKQKLSRKKFSMKSEIGKNHHKNEKKAMEHLNSNVETVGSLDNKEKRGVSGGLTFDHQTRRKDLFYYLIRNGANSPLATSSKPENKLSIPNFTKYPPRKPVFRVKASTPKDYDRSPEIKEKFNMNNGFLHCLVNLSKTPDRKLFNEQLGEVRKITTPQDFNLLQGFCKTHRILNTNIGCYSPKIARERPSPVQDRILKMNEKLGFDCFKEKPEEMPEKESENINKRETKRKKFDLQKVVKEVETEIQRENKQQRKKSKKNEEKSA